MQEHVLTVPGRNPPGRRRAVRLCAVAAGVLAVVLASADPAAAVVACQRKKKVTLRPGPACKKKERLAADLGSFADSSRLDAVQAGLAERLATAEDAAGLACEHDASKVFVPRLPGSLEPDGCRTFDADPAACAAAFQTYHGQASSCFHYVGRCLSCQGLRDYQGGGACVNACDPPECPAAPSRVFRGDEAEGGCDAQVTQADCETSFVTAELDFSLDPTTTCFWDATTSTCEVCFEDDQVKGACTGCGFPQLPCAGRAGPPLGCDQTTQPACEAAWQGGRPPTSCYWIAAINQCRPCYPDHEFLAQRCHDVC